MSHRRKTEAQAERLQQRAHESCKNGIVDQSATLETNDGQGDSKKARKVTVPKSTEAFS